MTNQEQYELIWEKAKKYDRLVEAFDKIKAEIERKKQKINFKKLDSFEKAQAETRLSTLDELLQIIDKYQREGEEV